MIAHLRGKLLDKHPNHVIVEAGGVGYDVSISVPTFSQLASPGSEVALFIHTHVREDALALYGFCHPEEKSIFEKLISVSGIGPKLAMTILSGMASDELGEAIRSNNLARLTKIPGVGRKTAERLVLELRDKMPPAGAGTVSAVPSLSAIDEDVLSALMNLGYQRATAEKALTGITRQNNGDSFEALFRSALAQLSK
ncbi:MAG: Holliday junction branch migration protein RuvA [Acidobacteria bacterium]|nr:MAG: Holliday junction branch migration protein RuvA [Acidobacteriota bacterium]